MTAPDKPGLSNEELKPCPMKSSHPYGATEVRELMPDYWMVQCLTAHHHVSVSGYKTKELAIEAWNRRAQSPPVAQVEVYREALEAIKQADNFGEIADHVVFRHKRMKASEVCDIALLTSKPEPVAPVRKWEAGEVVGERRCANPDCDTTLHVFMHNLSPEVQAALNGRKV